MLTTIEPRKVRRSEDFDALETVDRLWKRQRPYMTSMENEDNEDSIPSTTTKRWQKTNADGSAFVLQLGIEDGVMRVNGGIASQATGIVWRHPEPKRVVSSTDYDLLVHEGLAALTQEFTCLRKTYGNRSRRHAA